MRGLTKDITICALQVLYIDAYYVSKAGIKLFKSQCDESNCTASIQLFTVNYRRVKIELIFNFFFAFRQFNFLTKFYWFLTFYCNINCYSGCYNYYQLVIIVPSKQCVVVGSSYYSSSFSRKMKQLSPFGQKELENNKLLNTNEAYKRFVMCVICILRQTESWA